MAASFISYENTQRSSASQACAQAGVTLSSSKYESFTRRFLNALTAWRENRQKQIALFFTASIHGLVDVYHYRALSTLMASVELIPEEVVECHIKWLLSAVTQQAEQVV